jgi:pantoate--beta-alanine ligase
MAPRVLRTAPEVRQYSLELLRADRRLALVPTMGLLHEGHLSLMREAARRADVVMTSIFVNPTQFGPNEDYARYPRDLEGDLAKCAAAGVQGVFAPDAQQMYPEGHQTFVEVRGLSMGLCGERRPGHFRGVATVVAQLFALIRPQVALFGEKDYQQLVVIRRMSQDLHLDVEVVGLPTVREPDGLALSSRNSYLSEQERARALSLYRGLCAARHLVKNGTSQVAELVSAVRQELERGEVREDYVAIVDAQTLRPLERVLKGQPARGLVAGYVGTTRLIDNVAL